MNKRKIDVAEYAGDIYRAINKGILLNTKADGKVNTMTIGWGTFGYNWSKPTFAVYVRDGRATREILDKNPEFTVSIPSGNYDRKIIGYTGTHSARNTDKIKDLGLTLVESDNISVPAIKELPLTIECKVMYRQIMEIELMSNDMVTSLYPQDVPSENVGANKDPHVMYYGEIIDAYIIED